LITTFIGNGAFLLIIKSCLSAKAYLVMFRCVLCQPINSC
jgi:hypothetical protein